MNILMISSDPRVTDPHSEVYKRMQGYAGILGSLHVLVIAPAGKEGMRSSSLSVYGAGGKGKIVGLVSALRQARALCSRISFDMITAQDPYETGVLAYLIAQRFHLPLQLQVHTDILSPRYRTASWKEQIRFRIALMLLPRADIVRVVSERIKRSLLGAQIVPESKIRVVPVYIDFPLLETGHTDSCKKKGFAMISFGRFVEREKNIRMLIAMMRDFAKTAPDAFLVLVGKGPGREAYEADIRTYGLESRVILEEWRNDLGSYLKSFDLFLLSSNFEGWGRATLEAMHAGVCVVTTDVGLAGEIVQDGVNGRVVPVEGRKEFLNAVAELYRNPEKRIQLAKKGQETALQLAEYWKENYARLYRESFEILNPRG